eukprot:TRINITY_DN532_c0_g1_i3.p1 TRINITY_DN532_c0_g1~~TRINITY_DN532_c0_g1_i3.p1  ORF type:complete len:400 (+),score=236.54 TRINITY_DN532_c0_g1_i3:1242-2441(+)
MAPKRTAPTAKTAPAKPAAAPKAVAASKAAAPTKEVVAKKAPQKNTQPQTRAQTKKTATSTTAAPVVAEKDPFKKSKKFVPLPEELSSDEEGDFGKLMDEDMAPAVPTKISKTQTEEEDHQNDESDDDFDDEELDRQIAQLREEFGEDDDDEESDDDEEDDGKEDQEMVTAKAKFVEAKLSAKLSKAAAAAPASTEDGEVEDQEEEDEEEDDEDDDDDDLAAHVARRTAKPTVPRGTVFLGNIPYGFFENEMHGYFSQFGTITNLRLLRSKKTGNSKRCAFIEFEDANVAEIVAETTTGYIMFNRILNCAVVPPETVKERKYWKWARMNLDPVHVPPHIRARQEIQKPKTLGTLQRIIKKQAIKEKKREKKLAELGITYDFPKLSKLAPKPAKHIIFED